MSRVAVLYMIGCCVVWFSANSLASIYTKVAFQQTAEEEREVAVVDLFVCKMAATCIVGYIYLQYFKQDGRKELSEVRSALHRPSLALALVTTVHSLGTITLDASYITLPASVSQALKGSEPLFTLLVSGAMGMERFTSLNISAAVMVGVGLFLRGGSGNLELGGIALAILSSVCTPVRNILAKKHSLEKAGSSTTAVLVCTSALALILATPVWFVKLLMYGFSIPLWIGSISSVLFGVYQIASIVFLGFTSPFTHAIMNVLKRTTTLLSSMYYFQDITSWTGRLGVSLLLLGAAIFCWDKVRGPKNVSSGPSTGKRSALKGRISHFLMSSPTAIMGTALAFFLLLVVLLGYGLQAGGSDYDGWPADNLSSLPPLPSLQLLPSPPSTSGHRVPFFLQEKEGEYEREQKTTFSVWIYPTPIPKEGLLALKWALNDGNLGHVQIFCASTACLEQIEQLRVKEGASQWLTATRLNLPALTNNTPLSAFVTHHPYFKLVMGLDFLSQLHSVTVLSLLFQQGGTFLDLALLTEQNGCLPLLPPQCLLLDGGKLALAMTSEASSPSLLHFMELFASQLPPLPEISSVLSETDEFYLHYQATGTLRRAAGLARAACHSSSHSAASSSSFLDCSDGGDGALSSSIFALENFTPLKVQLEHHYATFSFDVRGGGKGSGPANSGDEMQGFSGLQFIPFRDHFVDRELLHDFQLPAHEPPVTLFANAWYGGANMQWPPSPSIDPLLFSLHFGEKFQRTALAHPGSLAFLKEHRPIGARDLGTLQFLQSQGVPSFFSACATLLIQPLPTKVTSSSEEAEAEEKRSIVVVDVPKSLVHSIVPQHLHPHIVYHDQNIPAAKKRNRLRRFRYAYALRRAYAQARLVITARIHAALPCVGMGVPVLFPEMEDKALPGGGGGRTAGLLDLFHVFKAEQQGKQWKAGALPPGFDWENPPPNPRGAQRDRHRATFWNVIRQREDLRDTALMMGLVPFLPAPPALFPNAERFHVMFTGKEEALDLVSRQALQSIFRHHPSAQLWLHSSTLSERSVEVFREVGYDLRLLPLDLDALLLAVNEQSRKKLTITSTKITSLSTAQQELLYRTMLLFVHGGTSLPNDFLLVRPLSSSSTPSPQPPFFASLVQSSELFLGQFEPGHTFLESLIHSFPSSPPSSTLQHILEDSLFLLPPHERPSLLPSSSIYSLPVQILDNACSFSHSHLPSLHRRDGTLALRLVRHPQQRIQQQSNAEEEEELSCNIIFQHHCVFCDESAI
ncbi:hypothetical protein QOT17_011508 [Balamuthia mandrillaris]